MRQEETQNEKTPQVLHHFHIPIGCSGGQLPL
jgi:hypothetical protein